MHYTKICNIDLNLDLANLKGPMTKSYIGLSDGKLQYNMFNDLRIQNSLPMFSTIKPSSILVAEIDGSGSLGPHRDHGFQAVINYYKISNNATTLFYKQRDNAKPFIAPGETKAQLYTSDDVEIVDSFTAKDHDVYLLDVSQIHAVSSPKRGSRLFLSYGFMDNSYQELLETLRFVGVNSGT